MDAHSEQQPVIEEAVDPTADLPSSAEEQSDFGSSLEQAFKDLEISAKEPDVADQLPPEDKSKEEPKAEEKAEEKSTEKSEDKDEKPKSKDESEEGDKDPIEELDAEIGDDWTPKAAKRFQQLKAELKTIKEEREQLAQTKTEYEAKIEELRGIAESKDAEALQEKLKQYEEQQMFADLEKTEAYKKAVTEPLDALMKSAEEMADKYDVKGDALIDIIALGDEAAQEEQLSELLPNASDRDKAKIFNMMEQLKPIRQRRAEMFENKDQALAEAKQLEEQRKLVEAKERAELRQNVTRNVVERVKQKLPFLSGIEGMDFSALEKAAAENDPSTLHPVDHAYNAVSSKILPPIVKEYVAARKEIELLTDRLAEYESAEPSMSGASKQDSSKTSSTSESFTDSLNARLAEAL